MSIRKKTLVSLITLGLVDAIIPLPVLALILIYVVSQRPPWFQDIVGEIYRKS
jgi:hypothetical protein